MPVMAGPEMTETAIADCLGQSVPTRILVINQGVEDSFRHRLERLAEEYSDRIFVWSHEPPLPSLSASWNRALDFVWQTGGEEALVVNNDVRLHCRTVELLRSELHRLSALFVTAVGVTAEQYNALGALRFDEEGDHGGPDFSCYLISRECHQQYRFDEAFIPAFCEDLDFHRRLMLAGDGDKIFSVNLPYLHLASQTLKQVDSVKRQAIEKRINEQSRAYYAKKWGGPVNQETFYAPLGGERENPSTSKLEWQTRCGPTTPELQDYLRNAPRP